MKSKWLGLVLVLAIMIGIVAYRFASPAAELTVIQPERTTIRAYVEEQAVTELPRDYLVAIPITGWLQPVELREGDWVEAGQVVARLENEDIKDRIRSLEYTIADLETQIDQTKDHQLERNALIQATASVKAIDETVEAAEAKLEASKAVVEFAESEVKRIRKLIEQNAASDRELRAAETDVRKARADYRGDVLNTAALKTLAAVSYIGPKFIRDYIDYKSYEVTSYEQQRDATMAELQIEKRNLARTELASPVDGVVLEVHHDRHQYLSAGTPVLTIGQLDQMEVVAEVLTQRATRIVPGDPVEIYGEALGDDPIAGEVYRIYPAGFEKVSSLGVEQQRVDVAIKLADRPEGLGVAYRVNVRIFHDEAEDALTLPRTALFRGNDGAWEVLVVRNGVVELQVVRLGIMNDHHAQVVEGLSENDHIVAHPSREIEPGMRVTTKAD